MKMLKFSCPCGLRLTARITEGVGAKLRIYAPVQIERPGALGLEPVTCCPNCQRDFSKATVDEFLQNVWP